MKLEGVFVATATPFDAKGDLNFAVYERHVDFLIEGGVQGLVPCGTTGESPTLSQEERGRLISICVEKARPRGVAVLAGCGGNSTVSVAKSIAEAEALGVDGTMVVTPYYNKPTPAGLLAHYRHLADRCQTPMVLYHVPGRTNVFLSLETVAQLFEHPRIAGIKEASGQYSYWLGLAQIARETGRAVLAGDDDAFAIQLALGGKGLISTCANVLPRDFVSLWEDARAGRWEDAFRKQLRLAPLVKAFFAETNPGPLKYALSRVRDFENTLRLPLVPISDATAQGWEKQWRRYTEGTDA